MGTKNPSKLSSSISYIQNASKLYHAIYCNLQPKTNHYTNYISVSLRLSPSLSLSLILFLSFQCLQVISIFNYICSFGTVPLFLPQFHYIHNLICKYDIVNYLFYTHFLSSLSRVSISLSNMCDIHSRVRTFNFTFRDYSHLELKFSNFELFTQTHMGNKKKNCNLTDLCTMFI